MSFKDAEWERTCSYPCSSPFCSEGHCEEGNIEPILDSKLFFNIEQVRAGREKNTLVEVAPRIVALYHFEDAIGGLHLAPLPKNNVLYRIVRIVESDKHPGGFLVDLEDQAGTIVELGLLREDGMSFWETEEVNGGVLIRETTLSR